MTTEIQKFNDDVTRELANPETLRTLVATTFKGISEANVKQAIVEGMMRGFTFQDFLKKNIYAIPYGDKYSLVTSIDYARKIGMRSGVVGNSEPTYTEKEGRILTCSVTVKRKVHGETGEFTATVYFSEYTTGKNLWQAKPRTMIAKVAEMHALRKACPEEMSQVYVSEEVEQKVEGKPAKSLEPADISIYEKKLRSAKTLDELKTLWSSLPAQAKTALNTIKDEIKATLK